MIVLRSGELEGSHADESVNDAPKPDMVWYVVDGLTVMVWLAVPEPEANTAPVCGASSLLWSAVVSQTETAVPAAAFAVVGTMTAPATSAVAASAARMNRVRNKTFLLRARVAKASPDLLATVGQRPWGH